MVHFSSPGKFVQLNHLSFIASFSFPSKEDTSSQGLSGLRFLCCWIVEFEGLFSGSIIANDLLVAIFAIVSSCFLFVFPKNSKSKQLCYIHLVHAINLLLLTL